MRYIDIVIVNYVLTGIATLLLVLRCFVRFRIVKRWGWDDFFMFVSWAGLVVQCVILQIFQQYGVGNHVWNIPPQTLVNIVKWIHPYEIVNLIITFLTKVSISFFILRIKDTFNTRLVLTLMMIMMGLATLEYIIFNVIICIPLAKLWNPSMPGTCLPFDWFLISAYIQSGFTIVVDLALTASPIVILWNIKISARQKVMICGPMSLGLLATIANALRNACVKPYESPDFTYASLPIILVGTFETNLGVIAACIPACWPIFRWLQQHGSSRPSPQTTGTASSEEDGMLKVPIESKCKIEPWGNNGVKIPSPLRVAWDPPTPTRPSHLLDSENFVMGQTTIGVAM